MKLFSWEYIKDVNYSYFYIRGIEELDELKFWGKKSFVLRIIIYFYYLAKRVMVDIYTIKRLTIKIDNKVIFYPISNNNIEPMVGINNAMKMESIFLSPDRKLKHTFILPMSYSYLLGLIFIPILVINYFNFSRDEKYRIKLFGNLILLSYGYTLFWYIILSIKKPFAFVFANDHVFETRVLNQIAKYKGIKTYYVQHAPVTKYFPELAFTGAFLEGEYSLQCYKKTGCAIYISGNLKFESFRNFVNKSKRIDRIGIAISAVIDLNKMQKTIQRLKTEFPEIIYYYRPHIELKEFLDYEQLNLQFSDMRIEKTFSFLSKIDLLISGNSGILIEAGLMNVNAIRFIGAEHVLLNKDDDYKLTENNVCYTFSDEDEIIAFIKAFRFNRPKPDPRIVEYYYANAFNPVNGNTFRYVANIIERGI